MEQQQQAHDQDGYEQLQPHYEPLAPHQTSAPGVHHQPATMPQSGPQQQPYPQQQYPQQQYPQQQYPQQQYPGQGQQYPTQVIIQTGPNNGGACGGPYEKYKTNQSIALGLMQVFIGVLCIIFNIIGIIYTATTDYRYYSNDITFYIGYGMWPSFFFIIAGGFGIGARSKNPCPVISFMVMSILAAVFTMFIIGFSATGIALVATESYGGSRYYQDYQDYVVPSNYNSLKDSNNNLATTVSIQDDQWAEPRPEEPEPEEPEPYDQWPQPTHNSYSGNDYKKPVRLAMHCLLVILGVVELVVAIWSSAICCAAACCGRNNNGNVHATPMVQYGGQAGQQQVFNTQGQQQVFNTQGQQQTFNSQPQPGGSSYPAAGPGLPQPSASAPGMPPAYSAASAPPMYGGPPHEEKLGMPRSN